ncbi:hypothetical protein CGBL_0125300 [Corynebacterium glutamicum]|nr:hypothetical protein CGBL_0125300 [Corynebacterium glutamicum]
MRMVAQFILQNLIQAIPVFLAVRKWLKVASKSALK